MGLHTTQESQSNGRMLFVLTDGALREKVEPGTEGAVMRVNKNEVEVHELLYPGITGFVTGVTTNDFGNGLNILIGFKDEEENEFTVVLPAAGRFGEQFLHKLPGIDFTKELTLKCYNFEKDGRKNIGVSLKQDGEALLNKFWEWDKSGNDWVKKYFNDEYPQPDKKTIDKGTSEVWNMYYTNVRLWLIDYLTEQGLITEPVAKDEVDF